MGKIQNYSNDEITVVWKPEVCIHAAKCVHKLPQVFKPKDKPWVQLENSNSEEIIEAVNGCPSGALTIKNIGVSDEPQNTSDEVSIVVQENGPLLVHGELSVRHSDGHFEKRTKMTAFCRCGKTANNPYCDGSHKGD